MAEILVVGVGAYECIFLLERIISIVDRVLMSFRFYLLDIDIIQLSLNMMENKSYIFFKHSKTQNSRDQEDGMGIVKGILICKLEEIRVTITILKCLHIYIYIYMQNQKKNGICGLLGF